MLALSALLCVAPAAHASTLGLQDDEGAMYDPGVFSQRADALGAAWVRLTVYDTRWATQADGYVFAARLAQQQGRHVLVTLTAWETHPTPAQWRRFAQEVVDRMAPWVDAWSPMNEPNHPKFMGETRQACRVVRTTTRRAVTSVVQDGVRVERRYRRVRRGHGRYLRQAARGRRPVRFTRAHGRRQHRRASWRLTIRRVPLSHEQTVMVSTAWEQQRCAAEAAALTYRRIWDTVAPLLRADSGSLLVAGDVAPSTNDARFMDTFFAAGPLETPPDVLGVHPYDWDGPSTVAADGSFRVRSIEATAAYARSHSLRLWVTEWAYGPEHPAAWWPAALARFGRAGVELAIVYDVDGPTWNTRMTGEAVDALVSAGT